MMLMMIMMMVMMMMMVNLRIGGRTNFILRIKKYETRLKFQEYDDDDEDDNPRKRWRDLIPHEDRGTGNRHNTLEI